MKLSILVGLALLMGSTFVFADVRYHNIPRAEISSDPYRIEFHKAEEALADCKAKFQRAELEIRKAGLRIFKKVPCQTSERLLTPTDKFYVGEGEILFLEK